jgi:hypothetical protein
MYVITGKQKCIQRDELKNLLDEKEIQYNYSDYNNVCTHREEKCFQRDELRNLLDEKGIQHSDYVVFPSHQGYDGNGYDGNAEKNNGLFENVL